MSRLDSVIRRLTAQRACLDQAANLLTDVPGPVLELGLGNGRTFDHLRTILPGREIFVFDREIVAHPDYIPDVDHTLVGTFDQTLPRAGEILPGRAALAHCDIGTGDKAASEALARFLVPLLVPLMADGAIILGDQPMEELELESIALPDGVSSGRYFMYRLASRD
jgi:hypothetical protein